MSDASQVRINELARELEVKAKAIIDLLPGFGVTEKKTHSSSIPVEAAEKVRHHLKGLADAEAAADAERAAKEAAARAALRLPMHLRHMRPQPIRRRLPLRRKQFQQRRVLHRPQPRPSRGQHHPQHLLWRQVLSP